MKLLIYLAFIFMYVFITVTILAPILFTDGAFLKKLIALLIAIFLYFILTFILLRWKKASQE